MKNISTDIHLDIQFLDLVKKTYIAIPKLRIHPRLLLVIKVELDA